MLNHDLRVAIYARVSGEQQARDETIASQLEAVTQRIASDALECEPELCFLDDGYSGHFLVRPGLERLRDQAAAGVIDRLYVLDPDRFSRRYAYQVLISKNLPIAALNCLPLQSARPRARGDLLLQVQGMIAEYEGAKILDAAVGASSMRLRGSVNVLAGAPYGYHYIGKHEGRRGALSGRGRRGPSRAKDLRVGRPGAMLDRRGLPPPETRTRSRLGPANRPGTVR